MGNIPLTIWRQTSGDSEATNPGVMFIVDTVGNFLVDTVGNFIVDTGTDFRLIPATIWTEDNSQ